MILIHTWTYHILVGIVLSIISCCRLSSSRRCLTTFCSKKASNRECISEGKVEKAGVNIQTNFEKTWKWLRCANKRNCITSRTSNCNAFGGLVGRGCVILYRQSCSIIDSRTEIQVDSNSGLLVVLRRAGDGDLERLPEVCKAD